MLGFDDVYKRTNSDGIRILAFPGGEGGTRSVTDEGNADETDAFL